MTTGQIPEYVTSSHCQSSLLQHTTGSGPQGTAHLGHQGATASEAPELGCRELPMHKVCIGKYFLRIARNTPELGQWPSVPDSHSPLWTRAPLSLLYDRKQAAGSRRISFMIPPLCQSSFYLNAFSCQKCLVTFAPTFLIPFISCLTFISCSLNFPKWYFFVCFSLSKKIVHLFQEKTGI